MSSNIILELNPTKLGHCPKILRVDKGTENLGLADTHTVFQLQHDDDGPSKHNIVSSNNAGDVQVYKVIKIIAY